MNINEGCVKADGRKYVFCLLIDGVVIGVVSVKSEIFLAPTGAQGVKMSVRVCDFLQKRTLDARSQAKAPWKGQGSSRESLRESSRESS